MMACGIAVQTSGTTPRALLYAIATARDLAPGTAFIPPRIVPDGASEQSSFFTEPGLFGIYALDFNEINTSGGVRTLQLRQKPEDGYDPSSALLLGLARSELDTLRALSTQGLDQSMRTVLLDGATPDVDSNGVAYTRYRAGIQGLKTSDGTYATEFPANDIFVYTLDRQLFASAAFTAAETLPLLYTRNFEEEKGSRDWPVRERLIDAVDTGTSSITFQNVDWTDEVVTGDPLKLHGSNSDGQYTVASIALSGADTVIALSGAALNAGQPFGKAVTLPKKVEDHFIDLDQETLVAGSKMRTLVNSFVSTTPAVPKDLAALEAQVDVAAGILDRARKLAKFDNTRADDYERCLYWARLSMTVALKSHPYCMAALQPRNALLKRFERVTRGYDVDFTGAPAGAKRVVVTGFDPYQLYDDIATSNPSAAVALALHGETISDGGKTAYIASAIFPTRYRDFDAGTVEDFMTPLFGTLSPKQADMIVTVSQNGSSPYYDVERFAGRLRGGLEDNEYVRFPPTKVGGDFTFKDFYETTLPVPEMVPGPFNDVRNQRLFFDQSYIERIPPRTTDSRRPHPANGGVNGNMPSAAAPFGDVIEGSGGQYLSNEIFYRTSKVREDHSGTATKSGHFHIPGTREAKTGIEDIIAEVRALIKRGLAGL
jgi:pyrrolidone-carboxylate peptidase